MSKFWLHVEFVHCGCPKDVIRRVWNQQEGWAGALALGISADGHQGTGWKQNNKTAGRPPEDPAWGRPRGWGYDVSDAGSLNDTRLYKVCWSWDFA